MFHNVNIKKYGYVELNKRHGNSLLPQINLINLKEKYAKGKMKGHFSEVLISQIRSSLDRNEQIILFQNRRGYAPIIECLTCGVSPQCPNCDVSLTYHKQNNELRCHYCYHYQAMPKQCNACGNSTLDNKGFGTEQIEQVQIAALPTLRVDTRLRRILPSAA